MITQIYIKRIDYSHQPDHIHFYNGLLDSLQSKTDCKPTAIVTSFNTHAEKSQIVSKHIFCKFILHYVPKFVDKGKYFCDRLV